MGRGAQFVVQADVERTRKGELAQQLAIQQRIAAFAVSSREHGSQRGVGGIGIVPGKQQACLQVVEPPGAVLGERALERIDLSLESFALGIVRSFA